MPVDTIIHAAAGADLTAVASSFALPATVAGVAPLGSGNVNATYLVQLADGGRAVLQRLNTAVFQRPELVMANIRRVGDHVRRRLAAPGVLGVHGRWEVPTLVPTLTGADGLVLNGQVWRVLTFVADAHCPETIESPTQAQELGRGLGIFHRLIHDLPTDELADTLEGFHITPLYLQRFEAVAAAPTRPLCATAERCCAFVAARHGLAPVLERARAAGRLPLRPIHGDPKVSNVMLDRHTGRAVALIDLDTVKPGLVHTDIGDCLRSGANPAGEEATDLAAVRFDLELAEAILRGYMGAAGDVLSDADHEHLYDAIRLLPFELGLRFLTDHLEGDVYFRSNRPGHNLERAQVQFRLTESVEAQESEIRALLEALR
ncbi:MAG: aminoglycoside phosphotransferase family protein [Cyanobacteriota bacterium]|nr:aminoglycoside phosphotransferase family protein [Cyanobacteriota bacterium]